jgi:fumarylacetoacetate (FAA) hydrolase
MWKRRDMEIPEAWYRLPIFYFSNVSEIRGPGEPVWAPRGSQELDYELEVAAVIDTPVRDLDAARGDEAIGGYTILNDWSARDLQREETTVRLGPAKGKDFASSIGPWLVTPDELGELGERSITCRVNGEVVQSARLGDMHFTVGRIIAELSAGLSLEVGDVILTGTPEGTGVAREPAQFLAVGDVVEAGIDGIGEVRSEVVASYPSVVDTPDIFDYVHRSSAAGGSPA